jgi:hypothetical protein
VPRPRPDRRPTPYRCPGVRGPTCRRRPRGPPHPGRPYVPAGLPALVAERPDLRFGVDDFGLAADGTAALLGGRGLLGPHVAGVTAESLSAMEETAVRGTLDLLRA